MRQINTGRHLCEAMHSAVYSDRRRPDEDWHYAYEESVYFLQLKVAPDGLPYAYR